MPPTALDRQVHVEQFARTLSDLRQAAGCPSFRQMAATSGCISHATLHEATRGKRLPTWETTEQFLLACSTDPRQWRQEWLRADRLVNRTVAESAFAPVAEPAPEPTPVPALARELGPAEPHNTLLEPLPSERKRDGALNIARGRGLWWMAAPLAVVLVLGAVFVVARWGADAARRTAVMPGAAPSTAAATAVPSAATAPSKAVNVNDAISCPGPGERIEHQWTSSVIRRGGMTFRDGRLGECSIVRPDSAVQKGFSLENSGTVAWAGWRMHRVSASGPCTIDAADFALPSIAPGHTFMMSVQFHTAVGTGICRAEWEIRDSAGREVFPGASRIPLTVMVATG
ncbi:hypothetical protein [Calidifontibacter terrae]